MSGRLTEEGLFATAASANDTLTHYERSELAVKTFQTGSNWPIESKGKLRVNANGQKLMR